MVTWDLEWVGGPHQSILDQLAESASESWITWRSVSPHSILSWSRTVRIVNILKEIGMSNSRPSSCFQWRSSVGCYRNHHFARLVHPLVIQDKHDNLHQHQVCGKGWVSGFYCQMCPWLEVIFVHHHQNCLHYPLLCSVPRSPGSHVSLEGRTI